MLDFETSKQKKKHFIKNELEQLVKVIDNDILYLEYVITQYNEEYVIVWYKGQFPSGTPYRCMVNITANSISQVAIDTIKRIR